MTPPFVIVDIITGCLRLPGNKVGGATKAPIYKKRAPIKQYCFTGALVALRQNSIEMIRRRDASCSPYDIVHLSKDAEEKMPGGIITPDTV